MSLVTVTVSVVFDNRQIFFNHSIPLKPKSSVRFTWNEVIKMKKKKNNNKKKNKKKKGEIRVKRKSRL